MVSHLGAVLGFVAGSVKRAPPWMRRSGLEWLWRVKEGPHLWRRYVADGLAFLWILASYVVPCALRRLASDQRRKHTQYACRISESETGMTMTLTGALGRAELLPLKQLCHLSAGASCPLTIDHAGVTEMDNACLAALMLLQRYRRLCGLTTRCITAVPHEIIIPRY